MCGPKAGRLPENRGALAEPREAGALNPPWNEGEEWKEEPPCEETRCAQAGTANPITSSAIAKRRFMRIFYA